MATRENPGSSATLVSPEVEELKQSVERLQALVDEAPAGICHTDLKGTFTYVNKRFEEVSGYSWEDVVGKNGFKLGILPDDAIRLLGKRIKDRLMGEPSRLLEFQFKCKDGHLMWVAMEGKLLREKGMPVGFQIIANDVTERKQAEEALRQSEQKYRRLFELSPIGITTVDMKGVITECNPAVYKEGGYSQDELIGKHFSKVAPIRARDIHKQIGIFSSIIRGKVPQPFEVAYNRKDGTIGWTELHIGLLKADGKKLGVQVLQRDITERKRAEEALQAEKNKLQSLIDALEYGLSIQDMDYNIIYQNEPLRETFGDHLGEKCYRAYENREEMCDGCPVKKAFRDGKSHTLEGKRVTPAGKIIFLENTANPIRDARGKIVSCLEIIRNVTERKQAEETLQKSQEALRKMFESVTDGILVIDLNGVITEVNQRAAEIHGFSSRDELLGKNALELVVPRDHEKIATNVRKALKQGSIRGVEYTLLKADGAEFPGELSTSVLRDASGNPVGHVTIARDITERKQAEAALRLQRAYFQQLFDNSPDAIVLVDDTGRVVRVNKGFEKLFGYRAEEVKGRFIEDIVVPEDRIEESSALSRTSLNGEVVRKETVRKCKDGSLVDVSILGYPIQFDNKTIGVYLIYSDITRRRQAEEALSETNAQLQVLQQVAVAMHSTLDLQKVFKQITDGAVYSMGYTTALILTLNEEKKCFELSAISAKGQLLPRIGKILGFPLRNLSFPADPQLNAVVESVMGGRVAVAKTFVEIGYPAISKKACLALQSLGMTKNYILAPLKVAEWVVGGVLLSSPREGVSEGELTMVQNFAHVASQAIRNANLYAQTKQAEEELKLRAQVLDGATDSIFLHDFDENFIYVNETACKAHGYSREEFMKMKLHQVIAPERVSRLDSDFREMLEKGQVVFESAHLRKDGSIFPVEVHGRVIESGGRKLLLTVIRDITGRKRMEQAFRESEEKFYRAFHSSPNVICIVAPEDGRFIEVNESFTRFTGYTREEAIGRNGVELGLWAEQDERNRMKVIMSQHRNEEFHSRMKSGEIRVGLSSAETINIGDKPCIIIEITDVTERKRMEEELKEAQEQLVRSEKLAAVGQLASGVGHELRNPLGAIKNAAFYVRRRIAKSDLPTSEPKVLEFLDIIDGEVRGANKVIGDLLGFSRVAKPTVLPVKIGGIIEDALEHVPLPENVELARDIDKNLPMVMVDADQIRQVFVNIILWLKVGG
jgi:PAS domain S-box-containing protein